MNAPLFGPLPTHGIWSAVGLGRGQFLAILAVSVLCFVFVSGPVWLDPRSGHFARIAISYGIIPLGVAIALGRERPFPLGSVLAASALIALAKLVVTALLLVALVMLPR